MTSYLIRRVAAAPAWDGREWEAAQIADVGHFHPRGSDHRPRTAARVLHDGRDLLLRFDVQDRYVISRATRYQESVCLDSCVEWFVRPKADKGYFNIEINCGGTLLFTYIEDPRRTESGFAKCTQIPETLGRQLRIHHTMAATVPQEITQPTAWRIGCAIPRAVLEEYVGPLGELSGQTWAGNFYKCADRSSHPHWASWAPLGEELNFHAPQYFGAMTLE